MEGRMGRNRFPSFLTRALLPPAFSSSFKRRHRDVGYVSTYKGGFRLSRYFYVRI